MSLMVQILLFMLVTFVLGLALGWLIWRFGGPAQTALDSKESELDFWRSNLEQCRMELGEERNAVAALREERSILKRRIASLEKPKT